MIYTLKSNQTVIGNLSREAYLLRSRCLKLLISIKGCKDKSVLSRLKCELDVLEAKRQNIFHIAKTIKYSGSRDQTSIDFLIEICSRPLRINPKI